MNRLLSFLKSDVAKIICALIFFVSAIIFEQNISPYGALALYLVSLIISGGEKKGANPEGWWYYDEKQGRKRWTKGMPSRPFMYETARDLERKVVEIAREVFSR